MSLSGATPLAPRPTARWQQQAAPGPGPGTRRTSWTRRVRALQHSGRRADDLVPEACLVHLWTYFHHGCHRLALSGTCLSQVPKRLQSTRSGARSRPNSSRKDFDDLVPEPPGVPLPQRPRRLPGGPLQRPLPRRQSRRPRSATASDHLASRSYHWAGAIASKSEGRALAPGHQHFRPWDGGDIARAATRPIRVSAAAARGGTATSRTILGGGPPDTGPTAPGVKPLRSFPFRRQRAATTAFGRSLGRLAVDCRRPGWATAQNRGLRRRCQAPLPAARDCSLHGCAASAGLPPLRPLRRLVPTASKSCHPSSSRPSTHVRYLRAAVR